MVGDYIAAAYSGGNAFAVFAIAQANQGGTLSEAIYTTVNPLPQPGQSMRAVRRSEAAVNHRADHPPRRFFDLDHEHPIPPRRKSVRR
jgi:hypothetical protein